MNFGRELELSGTLNYTLRQNFLAFNPLVSYICYDKIIIKQVSEPQLEYKVDRSLTPLLNSSENENFSSQHLNTSLFQILIANDVEKNSVFLNKVQQIDSNFQKIEKKSTHGKILIFS